MIKARFFMRIECVYSSFLSGIFPSADSSTAIQRVESNWAHVIYTATNIGTLKNIPAIPHIMPQKTKLINMAKVDRFNVFPVNFGSIIFPNSICRPIKPTAVNKGCCNDVAVTKEYRIGNPHATNAPMVGM